MTESSDACIPPTQVGVTVSSMRYLRLKSGLHSVVHALPPTKVRFTKSAMPIVLEVGAPV
ncbi:MAG TPA: hypothetical protein VIJ75_01055 [Hanamia sp.]